MDKRKFCPVYRWKGGCSETGFLWLDGGPPEVYLTEKHAGGRYLYADDAGMQRDGWRKTLVGP